MTSPSLCADDARPLVSLSLDEIGVGDLVLSEECRLRHKAGDCRETVRCDCWCHRADQN